MMKVQRLVLGTTHDGARKAFDRAAFVVVVRGIIAIRAFTRLPVHEHGVRI